MEWFDELGSRFAHEVSDELAALSRTRPTISVDRIDATHPMNLETRDTVASLITAFVGGLPDQGIRHGGRRSCGAAIPFVGHPDDLSTPFGAAVSDAYSPVPELNELKEFEERCGNEYYADGFELVEFGRPSGAETYSEEQEFIDSFVCFARANRTGSDYAFWRVDDRPDLATVPVVVFGDEGGIGIVAGNLRDLLRQLGCDWWQWPSWEGAQFMAPDPDDKPSPRHGDYLEWLKETFDLTPPDDPNELRHVAEGEFGTLLENWVDRFYQEE